MARAIWLHFRFNLSLREVEEMMLARGVVVSYETIRRWCRLHGVRLTARLRRKSPSASDVWHLDEVVVRIGGRKCWLWRVVDQDGYVLDEIVQTRRNIKAARCLLVRLLKKQGGAPKRIVTDKLRSYGEARRQVMPDVDHRSHKGLNNRAENSHLPLRKRERTRQGFQSIRPLQHFVLIFSVTETISFLQVLTSPLTRSGCFVKTLSLNGEPRHSNLPEIPPVAQRACAPNNVTAPQSKKAAWEYLKFAIGPKGQTIVVETTGYLPTNKLADGAEYLAPFYEKERRFKTVASEIELARPWEGYPIGSSVRIWRAARDVIAKVMRGDLTPEDGLPELVTTVDAMTR